MSGTALTSIVEVKEGSPFTIYNLPYGVFSTPDRKRHIGVAIGEEVLDLTTLQQQGEIEGEFFQKGILNPFLEEGKECWSKTRCLIQELLSSDQSILFESKEKKSQLLLPQAGLLLHLPVSIGDYTDFYSSKEHASNVGRLFRGPGNELLSNWSHLPVAYHGRASSVVVSGTEVVRPNGQVLPPGAGTPQFQPTSKLDFELEVGWIIGKGNSQGLPISVEDAYSHLFGMVLVNDWSARDIQAWEYQPLGPFLSKSFATSMSAWIVPMEALEPFRVKAPVQEPNPLPYLQHAQKCSFDISLEVSLIPRGGEPSVVSRGNAKTLYWDVAQQLAHHSSNGCPLRCGDLIASGTISGEDKDSFGSLLELTENGKRPIDLVGGDTRRFLEDGDEVVITGSCEGRGIRVGFGEVRGKVGAFRG